MADEWMEDATPRVPPDTPAKNTENDQPSPTNKADAEKEKVKEDELIDDRFQATDN